MNTIRPAPHERVDADQAWSIWQEYERTHDVSDRKGQAIGVDPTTGKIWFGKDAMDICAQQVAAGEAKPLFFAWVGSQYYLRKGGGRR